jgi:hypothetical protein
VVARQGHNTAATRNQIETWAWTGTGQVAAHGCNARLRRRARWAMQAGKVGPVRRAARRKHGAGKALLPLLLLLRWFARPTG